MKHLTLLQINDLHGYLAPHPELFDLARDEDFRPGGGLAGIATVLRTVRRDVDGAAITLDNGDTFHGTMPAVLTRGDALIAPMRALGIDAMTVHWEFAYGLARIGQIADQLPYPILAANYHPRPGAPELPPFAVIDRAGIKVGIIGLASIMASHLLPPDERDRVALTMGDAELTSLIPLLRADHAADVIVVLSHLGFPQDCKLAAAVSGIDVLLSGHTHHRLTSPVVINDTIIMQSGAHGSFVGRLDLALTSDGVEGWTHDLIPVDAGVEPDAELTAIVDKTLAPFARPRANVVGDTACALHRYAMFESTMDNLLLDATAAAAGTRVALSNGWRYGAPIPAGPLTESDVWNIVPANPPVSVVTLTGSRLRQLFEQNLEATFACDPWNQRGGYVKRCRGVELLLKLENPAGHRVQQLTIGGERLGDDEALAVAFLGEQAVPANAGTDRRTIGITAIEALESHVRSERTVTPSLRGDIRLV